MSHSTNKLVADLLSYTDAKQEEKAAKKRKREEDGRTAAKLVIEQIDNGFDCNAWNLVVMKGASPIQLIHVRPYSGDMDRVVYTYVAQLQDANAYHEKKHILAVNIHTRMHSRMFHAYFINRVICSELGTGVAKYIMAPLLTENGHIAMRAFSLARCAVMRMYSNDARYQLDRYATRLRNMDLSDDTDPSSDEETPSDLADYFDVIQGLVSRVKTPLSYYTSVVPLEWVNLTAPGASPATKERLCKVVNTNRNGVLKQLSEATCLLNCIGDHGD